jgi:hypothetical protein
MTSYFSRLIQQTGITVGTEKRSPQLELTGLALDFPAIEQESLRKFAQVSSEPLPNHQVEVADVVNPVPASVDRPSNFSTSPSEMASQRSQPAVEQDVSLTDAPLAKVLEVEKPSTLINENGPTPPLNRHPGDRRAIQPAVPSESYFRLIAPFPEQQTEPPSQAIVTPHNRQTALQAVRAWVAKPSESLEQAQTPHVDSNPPPPEMALTEGPQPIPTSMPGQPSPRSPHFQETIQPTQVRPPEAQNFVLSIGTIHLTIEQPQQKVQRHQPPPVKPERVVPPSNPSSRLNRHYIRLR